MNAYDFEINGVYYKITSSKDLTCEVVKGDSAYSGDIVIPSQVTVMNKTLKVEGIEEGTFSYCSGLTSVSLPNSITSLNVGLFEYCTSLLKVTLPDNIKSISIWAFYGCSSLSTINIPNSVTSIGSSAFYDCYNLSSVTLPDSLSEIDDFAFFGCSNLKSINYPHNLTTIGYRAFSGCASLEKFVLYENVTNLYDCVFEDCGNLKEVISFKSTPPSVRSNTFKNVSKAYCIIKVPKDAVEKYQNTTYWKDFLNIIAIDDNIPDDKKCEKPKISLVNGNIVAESSTEGSKCHVEISSSDINTFDGEGIIKLSGVYEIKAYAYAEGYSKSEDVIATLVWMNPAISDDDSDIESIVSQKDRAIVIQKEDNSILISGTQKGNIIQLFSKDGVLLKSVEAVDDVSTMYYSYEKDCVYIIKYGNRAVKFIF